MERDGTWWNVMERDGTWWNHAKHVRTSNELVMIWEGVPWQVQTRHAVAVPARTCCVPECTILCFFSWIVHAILFWSTEPLSQCWSLHRNWPEEKNHRNRPLYVLTTWSPHELFNCHMWNHRCDFFKCRFEVKTIGAREMIRPRPQDYCLDAISINAALKVCEKAWVKSPKALVKRCSSWSLLMLPPPFFWGVPGSQNGWFL